MTRTASIGQPPQSDAPRRPIGGLEALAVGMLLLLVGQHWLLGFFEEPALQTWATVFVSIVIQALPFLVFGVALSAVIAAFVPADMFSRLLPKSPSLAVLVAGPAGIVLPGCECASVPVAGRLISSGVTPAAAFAFLLAAPAINPIVLVSTAVAFPGQPEIVAARFLASLGTAVVMGLLWVRFGRETWLRRPRLDHLQGLSKAATFRAAMQHDFLHAGGFLVLGGLVAATLNVVVPKGVIDAFADNPVLAVGVLGLLAVMVAICSEADAFVAASFREFGTTAQLAFMVVGPAVDVKLISLQAGTFGRAFAVRFAPTTLLVAIASSVAVAWWLL